MRKFASTMFRRFIEVRRKWSLAIVAVLLVGATSGGWQLYTTIIAAAPSQFWAIDVGQGDALLLKTRNGQTILIDGGKDRSLLDQLGRILGPFQRTIDLVILTHPHQDHIGGLVSVLERYRVATLLYTGVEYDNPDYSLLRAMISARPDIQVLFARARQQILIDSGLITVLWPPESLIGRSPPPEAEDGSGGVNDSSIVLDIELDGHRLLLMGDVSFEVEKKLLESHVLQDVDVVKIGHHGSRFSTSQQFLEVVKPEIAIISAGIKNDYAHPAQSVLRRLEEVGAHIYQTLKQGTIRLDLLPDRVQVQPERRM